MFDFENWDLSPWEEWEGQISIADRVNGVKLVSTFCYSSESDNTEAVCLCLALLHDYLQQSILTFAEAAFEYHFDMVLCVEITVKHVCLTFCRDQREKRKIVGQVEIQVQIQGQDSMHSLLLCQTTNRQPYTWILQKGCQLQTVLLHGKSRNCIIV